MPARADKDYLQVYRQGKWENFLIKGVNMGISKPGYFPGEAAITREEYARWFEQIGSMHANTIRVYTIHPPDFYEALAAYNRKAKEPLYLLQGVWTEEEALAASGDAFDAKVQEDFHAEIKRTVDLIHGNADLPARPGHASGAYRADVSAYVLGWVLGVEWDPDMVASTDDSHVSAEPYQGRYFRTENATAFERWLADAMETTAAYEKDRYGWERPISFTNWVTTDLLKHPSEPSPHEDMVSVDPNHIESMPAFAAGEFASYHVYPYYPDFFNFDRTLNAYVDFRGEKNGYAGYLNRLRKAHGMPVLIAEFGVPSSRGMTHRNVNGLNQGFLNEKEQGEIDARLWQDIVHERMAGGLVFTWQDEWFKRTWNTMDLDDPDRRPFWSNAQTSEQQYGLMAFDPGEEPAIVLDGDSSEWKKAGIPSYPAGGNDRGVQSFSVTSDERYVYFLLNFNPEAAGKADAAILIDSVAGQGQNVLPNGSALWPDAGIDFAIDIRQAGESRVWVDSYYDPFEYQYGHLLHLIDEPKDAGQPGNGRWNPIRLALNKPLEIPDREGTDRYVPFEAYETGKLRFGNGDPNGADYDSLADIAVRGGTMEVRIPWQLLNVKDPSTRLVMADLWKEGLEGSRKTDGFRLAVVDGNEVPAERKPVLYRWDTWEQPRYHERLKTSYGILKGEFERSEAGE
uniref:Family 2 glycosyl transferase n=2 Tax=Cohnella candidum TaxID=2674991 RepID=A0A3G3K4Y4_9BACL|nr:hypothetical protein EAV92_08860 [Cohnella candidum]